MALLEEKLTYSIVPTLVKKDFTKTGDQPFIDRISIILKRQDWMHPLGQACISGLAAIFMGALTMEEADLLESAGEFRVAKVAAHPTMMSIGDRGAVVLKPRL